MRWFSRFLLGALFCLHFSLAYGKPVVLGDPASVPVAASSMVSVQLISADQDGTSLISQNEQSCCAETSKSLKKIGLCQMGDLPLPFHTAWNSTGFGNALPSPAVDRLFQAVDLNDLFRPPIL